MYALADFVDLKVQLYVLFLWNESCSSHTCNAEPEYLFFLWPDRLHKADHRSFNLRLHSSTTIKPIWERTHCQRVSLLLGKASLWARFQTLQGISWRQ